MTGKKMKKTKKMPDQEAEVLVRVKLVRAVQIIPATKKMVEVVTEVTHEVIPKLMILQKDPPMITLQTLNWQNETSKRQCN